MKKVNLSILIFCFSICLFLSNYSIAGTPDIVLPDSDSGLGSHDGLAAFFDLRERESFIQITNNNETALKLHIQIFNVAQNCNENDFFDDYTVNDTHVYNMREILTNDGNPSGVVLPQDSYGIVVVSPVNPIDLEDIDPATYIGNFRVIDNQGFEYRSNLANWEAGTPAPSDLFNETLKFNFSQDSGVVFSDIVGIMLVQLFDPGEWSADKVTRTFTVLDVDIYDLNENPLSCRDIAYACVVPDSNFAEEILAYEGGNGGVFNGTNGANVASFEYGINEAILHSKNGELLCPGNNIGNGIVVFNIQGIAQPAESDGDEGIFNIFVGLNNGNGRGSMDVVWWKNIEIIN